jgi:3'-phosphoadenosine 5'-phosphosulfate sulfotransferase (PAPS reductase)/FAD synthetase
MTQGALFGLAPVAGPDLATYDVILANISGGKDSQTMLRVLVAAAEAAGVRDRVVCVFADLGDADEWPGTAELAAEHAAGYGLRFITVCRMVADPVTGERRQQGLLEYIEHRGKWPDAQNRYCTSDMKRGPISTVITRLVAEQRDGGVTGRRVRVLNVQGLRAQESVKRRLMVPFYRDERATNATRREVDVWLPIHGWTLDEVWADIRASGVRHHEAYDRGMPRLSCVFCVLASGSALVLAAQLHPEGARKRAELEARMGHTFQNGRSMAEIIERAEAAGPGVVRADDWNG